MEASSKKKPPKATISYVNVNRTSNGYRDKYKRGVEIAVREFASKLGKATDGSDFTPNEWKTFFKTVLIPLDKESEKKMIDLFINDRNELNSLLILHNTKASDNLAEVYFKKYMKESPTKWHDLDDFKQMALEGLAIAAQRFDVNSGNKFITYATWWVLNRVRKPNQEKGSFVNHTSMSAPNNVSDEDNNTTFEDILTPDMISSDFVDLDSSMLTPAAELEKANSDENYDFCSMIKNTSTKDISSLDKKKVDEMMKYLVSIVERNSDYKDKQIFLYMFKNIFKKCSILLPSNKTVRVNGLINEAAKSKVELLNRLKMDEKSYANECKRLMKRCYDGL